jgi:transglutaminase-like putative cysteine protease
MVVPAGEEGDLRAESSPRIEVSMLIRAGCEISLECEAPTAMIAFLSVHPSRTADLRSPANIVNSADAPMHDFLDRFGNVCTRTSAPAGRLTLSTDFVIEDSGLPDVVAYDACEVPVDDLPDEHLQYLLASRYCEVDRLSEIAWSLFGATPRGWARVQAIVDFVHRHIAFGYKYASPTRSAWEAYRDRVGVCRDIAHLAVTFCRAMSIPARYCTGYLGDIGVPPVEAPMDFSAWFEVFLGDQWYAFDARHNVPRAGRILLAQGRDASDVAITTTFGRSHLVGFRVITEAL